MNETVVQIARIKVGNFSAWFERMGNWYEISWIDAYAGEEFRFKNLDTARNFWHKEVVDRKNALHCYCC